MSEEIMDWSKYIDRLFAEQDRLRKAAEQRLEEKIDHLDEADRELFQEKINHVWHEFDTLAHSLKLQTQEMARRLDILNHAHEQIQEIVNKQVSIERFETYIEGQVVREADRVKQEEAKAEALKAQLAETRQQLEGRVLSLADQVEKTQKETTTRLEQQIEERYSRLEASINELKEVRQRQVGQSAGFQTVWERFGGSVTILVGLFAIAAFILSR